MSTWVLVAGTVPGIPHPGSCHSDLSKMAANHVGLLFCLRTELPVTSEEEKPLCQCSPLLCSDTQYKMTISMADWPSEASEVTAISCFGTVINNYLFLAA